MISNYPTYISANSLKNVKLKFLPTKQKQEMLEFNINHYILYLSSSFTEMGSIDDKDKTALEYICGVTSIISFITLNVSNPLQKTNVYEHTIQYLGQAIESVAKRTLNPESTNNDKLPLYFTTLNTMRAFQIITEQFSPNDKKIWDIVFNSYSGGFMDMLDLFKT